MSRMSFTAPPSRSAAAPLLLVTAGLLLAACQHPVLIDRSEAGPMCARYEVVEFVTNEINRQAPYNMIMPDSIGEQPTGDPAVVTCVAAVVNRNYDYTRYWRQSWQGYQEYSVRHLTNGYEVTIGNRLQSASR